LSNDGKELHDDKTMLDVAAKDMDNLVEILIKDVSISERLAFLIKGKLVFDTYEPIQISEFHMRQRYGNEPLEIDRDKEPNTLWTDENYIGQKL
jgi:hypothetical protein